MQCAYLNPLPTCKVMDSWPIIDCDLKGDVTFVMEGHSPTMVLFGLLRLLPYLNVFPILLRIAFSLFELLKLIFELFGIDWSCLDTRTRFKHLLILVVTFVVIVLFMVSFQLTTSITWSLITLLSILKDLDFWQYDLKIFPP